MFSSYSVFVFSTESDIPLPFFGEGTLFLNKEPGEEPDMGGIFED